MFTGSFFSSAIQHAFFSALSKILRRGKCLNPRCISCISASETVYEDGNKLLGLLYGIAWGIQTSSDHGFVISGNRQVQDLCSIDNELFVMCCQRYVQSDYQFI